jgi:hypothetical protein
MPDLTDEQKAEVARLVQRIEDDLERLKSRVVFKFVCDHADPGGKCGKCYHSRPHQWISGCFAEVPCQCASDAIIKCKSA